MTQGFLVVVLGLGLAYLVISGKFDCVIAAFRACYSPETAPTQSKLSGLNSVKSQMDTLLSPTI